MPYYSKAYRQLSLLFLFVYMKLELKKKKKKEGNLSTLLKT